MPTEAKILTVVFDTPIDPWELRFFRAAVSQKAGFERDLFHNHNNETGGFHYRLPLIQYKQERGRPILVCLNEGIEELQHFFSQNDWSLSLNGRMVTIRIAKMEVRPIHLGVRDTPVRYHIRNWLALNEDNHGTYQRLTGMVERLFFLEKILQNQIVGLLGQLGHIPDEKVVVRLIENKEEKRVTYKSVKMQAFSLVFEVNVQLPDYLGLGKGCSVGWGVVKNLNKQL